MHQKQKGRVVAWPFATMPEYFPPTYGASRYKLIGFLVFLVVDYSVASANIAPRGMSGSELTLVLEPVLEMSEAGTQSPA